MSTGTWVFIGVLTTLAGIIIRFFVPQAIRAKVRRTGGVVGSDEPDRPTVAPEVLPPPPSKALQQLDVYNKHVEDAVRLLNLSRARDSQSLLNLDMADEKIAEALLLRPDGFDSVRLQADIAIARADLIEVAKKPAAYEDAAGKFAAALELRRGIPDLFIGLGWSWLGVMQHGGAERDRAAIEALGAFTAGHATSRGNLWLIKGWGTAVDVMRRRNHPQAAAALAQYEAVLAQLTGPAAMAKSWFEETRAKPEPTWLPTPPLRDI